MTDEEIGKVEGGEGDVADDVAKQSIVLSYNLPDVKELKRSREVYTGIFLGKIAKWNDPAIVKDNPEAKLPNLPITVTARADSSGTTFVFTQHLSTSR